MADQQTYANHTRWYPPVHFVIIPLLLVNFIYQVVRSYQEPGWDRGVWVFVSLVLMIMPFAARAQALRAQDRVIRLEERLRYVRLLPADIVDRASELSTGKIIALRFASDAELPGLVRQVLDGKLTTSKEIKTAITNWRADHLRV